MAGKTQLETDHRRLLVGSGIRPTRQRLLVLEALAAEPNDATAQQIHAHLRDEACYRLCAAGDHHHHLVCTDCHRVVELGECELEPWLAQLGDEHSFTVTAHTVEVAGLCADCSAS